MSAVAGPELYSVLFAVLLESAGAVRSLLVYLGPGPRRGVQLKPGLHNLNPRVILEGLVVKLVLPLVTVSFLRLMRED